MQRYPAPVIGLAAALAALAGFVDAIAFSSLGGFFASFMSGNSTRAGVALGTGDYRDAVTAASLILSFLSGVILASVVNHAWPHRRGVGVMLMATALMIAAGVLDTIGLRPVALLCLASAMGAENGVFASNGHVRIGLTYMTGTLVRFGQHLAAALMGAGERGAWARDLMLWLGFLVGVIGGAHAYDRFTSNAFWLAATFSAALTLLLVVLPRALFEER